MLIDNLRAHVDLIRTHLPGVYRPELYADLFENFFFQNKTLNRLQTDSKYTELNFYLHAEDDTASANRVVDKMMTGLRKLQPAT